MKKALYAGTFDPFTLGHLSIANRALNAFGNLTILIKELRIEYFAGLLYQYIYLNDIDILVRGIRNASDLEYEVQMSQYLKRVSNVEIVYFFPDHEHLHTSSTLVRNIIISKNLKSLNGLISKSAIEYIFTL